MTCQQLCLPPQILTNLHVIKSYKTNVSLFLASVLRHWHQNLILISVHPYIKWLFPLLCVYFCVHPLFFQPARRSGCCLNGNHMMVVFGFLGLGRFPLNHVQVFCHHQPLKEKALQRCHERKPRNRCKQTPQTLELVLVIEHSSWTPDDVGFVLQ